MTATRQDVIRWIKEAQRKGATEPFITGDGRKVMAPTAHPRCRCAMGLEPAWREKGDEAFHLHWSG